jgi:hypothetical protein
MRNGSSYIRHLYWLDPAQHAAVIEELRRDRGRVYRVRQQPCEALYPRRELALVEPGAWDLRCRRQGSWYRASARNGHFLLVSSTARNELPLLGIITLEPFTPPRLARDPDVVEMLSDPRLPDILPAGWGEFSPWEAEAIRRYLSDQGIERSLQEVFGYYTVNHLNFLFPRFFVESREHGIVPYSVQETALVCSACVELFGIVGTGFELKYLTACPGLKHLSPAPGEKIRLLTAPLQSSPDQNIQG